MNESKPLPSRYRPSLADLARWALVAMLALWLGVIALGVGLHGLIVPRIGDWRGQIESWASQKVGARVQVDAIVARSEGIIPTIELHSLRLLDAQGDVALVVPKVVVGVSVRSLLRAGVEQLYVEGAKLAVRRDQAGVWHVAGVPLQAGGAPDGAGLEWLLSQPEVVLRQGRVWVHDDYAHVPAFGLEDVEVLLRGGAWRHAWHVSATPAQLGEVPDRSSKVKLTGLFRPALLSSAPTWQRWSGQMYASFDIAQLPLLPWPSDWLVQQLRGQGQARLWADVQRGVVVGVTADAALPLVAVDWQAADVAPLALSALAGRVQTQRYSDAWSLGFQHLSFQTSQGRRWESSDLVYRPITLPGVDQGHELELGRADLHIAADLAQRLPGLQAWQAPLQRLAPEGILEDVQLRWQPKSYQLKGHIQRASLQAQPSPSGRVGWPGVHGLSGTFELTEKGGQARLFIAQGGLAFPGVFEQPEVPIEHLQAKVSWAQDEGHWRARVEEASFHNADARGTLEAVWRTSDSKDQPFPGILQLKGVLHEAQGASVHRYLPVQLPVTARQYVRESVRAGVAQNVQFEVAGDLRHMPFRTPEAGRFYIEAPMSDVLYDYVPQSKADAHRRWPALHQVQGTLVFDGLSMEVRKARAAFQGVQGFEIQDVHVRIADLMHPRVQVQAVGTAPVQSMLDFVRQSPVQAWTGHALARAQAEGEGQLQLALDLPISDLHSSQVQGVLALRNNSLELSPGIPELQALQGQVAFSDQGFMLENVTGQSLGGPLRLAGGLESSAHEVRIQAQGVASAQGLQNAPWSVVQQVAEHAQGQTSYDLEIHASSQATQVQVYSSLAGLAINLPAPLHKASQSEWPLQVSVRQTAQGSQSHRVEISNKVHVAYEWSTAAPRPRGLVRLGHFTQSSVLPQAGVVAEVNLPVLDADAWLAWMPNVVDGAVGATAAAAPESGGAHDFLPSKVQLKVDQLLWQQSDLGTVRSDALYKAGHWQGQVQSDWLDGRLEWHPADAHYPGGRVFARLSRLVFPQSEFEREEPQAANAAGNTPQTLPALDIRVEDLRLKGLHLGRLDLLAINRIEDGRREWWLERFDLTVPEAAWKAHGRWAGTSGIDQPMRETSLTFTLDIEDAGRLLHRLGLPDAVAGGQGRMGGLVQWLGSPISPDRATMQGQVQLQIGQGQFLKVEPGAGKLLSVLSLQSLSRRMVLDFRDIFGQGLAFDFVRGDVHIRDGIAITHNLQMKGLNAAVLMEGQAHLVDETQDLRLVIVPEINAMTASLAASVVNPVMGLGTFLAQLVLRGPVVAAATRSFHVHGSWSDPAIERIKLGGAVLLPPTPSVPDTQGESP